MNAKATSVTTAVLTLICALTLTACGEKKSTEVASLPASNNAPAASSNVDPAAANTVLDAAHLICYSEGDSNGPKESSKVDCSKNNTMQTYAYFSPTDAAASQNLSDYESETPVKQAWRQWARVQCLKTRQDIAGARSWAQAIGVDPDTNPIHVASQALGVIYLPTPDQWNAGERRTGCATRLVTPGASSTVGVRVLPGTWSTTLGTATAAPNLQLCFASQGGKDGPVDCDKPHNSQQVFSFNAAALWDANDVAKFDINNYDDPAWSQLDQICTKAKDAVTGAPRSELKMVANIEPAEWNADKHGSYLVSCSLKLVDANQHLNGNLIGVGSAALPIVPGKLA